MAAEQVVNGRSADPDALVLSDDPLHPANHICSLCAHFYTLGWVTGTGGGASIRRGDKIYLAPTGVQKELIKPTDIFVLPSDCLKLQVADPKSRISHHDMPYLRKPSHLRASACTPLFMTSFRLAGANCCIHTHSQWAVLATLLCGSGSVFEMSEIEQIKGIPAGRGKPNLGFHDTLRIPIIENTAREEDLTQYLERCMEQWPDTYAVLVRRHGIYVWGEDVAKAKTICESLDYLFQLAVEMHKLGFSWVKQDGAPGVIEP